MEDPNFFYYAKLYLKPQGFSLQSGGNTFMLKFWATFVLIVQEIVLLFVTISIYFKYPDIESMVTTIAVTIGLLINTFKIGTVYFKINTFIDFLKVMEDFWEIPNETEKHVLMEHKILTNRISVANFVSLVLGVSWWILMPPALGVYETLTIGNTTWIPAYNVTFVESFNHSPGYELFTLTNEVSTVLCVLTGCGFDSYFLESCFYLSGHFKIIRERFRIIPFKNNSDDIRDYIGSTVRYHDKIMTASLKLQDIVTSAIFPFLILDSILMCTIFYTLLMISSILYTVAFSGLACAALAQIFLLTFSGDYLYSRSQKVLIGIYDSPWFEGYPSYRSLIIPPMMTSQKGIIFRTWNFEITLATFSFILQTAGSYVALIKSLT